jgi:hypothetical protein
MWKSGALWKGRGTTVAPRNEKTGEAIEPGRGENSMDVRASSRQNTWVEWSGGARDFVEEGKNKEISARRG